jgi:hypothetical protein
MRRPALALLARLLIAVAPLGGCAAPQPPTRPPDLEGAVIGRTPRLPARDGAAHLVIAAAPSRVDVALGPGVRVLEALPDGGYRAAESSDAWVGRVVQVWFSTDTAHPPSAPLPAGVVARRASHVVATQRR